jgi:DNA-binding NtrC family response regulator
MEKSVLLIDDNVPLARMMDEFLSLNGIAVVTKTDSKEALRLFRNSPQSYDIVITDQTMPGYTGVELSKHLLDIRPDVAIILCSGYSEHVDISIAQMIGVKRYLLKPVKLDALLKTVIEMCNEFGITLPVRQGYQYALSDGSS